MPGTPAPKSVPRRSIRFHASTAPYKGYRPIRPCRALDRGEVSALGCWETSNAGVLRSNEARVVCSARGERILSRPFHQTEGKPKLIKQNRKSNATLRKGFLIFGLGAAFAAITPLAQTPAAGSS